MQEGQLKRCNATSTRPRPEVTKWSGSWTEFSGNTLDLLRRNVTAAAHHEQDVANDAEQGHKELEFGQRLGRSNE